jgi:hypothetical protein
VKVSWRVALKNASRAQRQAKKLRLKELRLAAHSQERESILLTGCTNVEARSPSSLRYAPSMVWSDAPILDLGACKSQQGSQRHRIFAGILSQIIESSEKAPFWKLCTLIFGYLAILGYRPIIEGHQGRGTKRHSKALFYPPHRPMIFLSYSTAQIPYAVSQVKSL